MCPGEQWRLVRADVSVDVAEEEGLKDGRVNVVNGGGVSQPLAVTDGVYDWPEVFLSDRYWRDIEAGIDTPEGITHPAVCNVGVLRNVGLCWRIALESRIRGRGVGPSALAAVDSAEDEIGKALSHWRGTVWPSGAQAGVTSDRSSSPCASGRPMKS